MDGSKHAIKGLAFGASTLAASTGTGYDTARPRR